jgi:3-hydroxyisobutyrate dehydrogenase/2-hydroxy-3-oxopropionate reductase
MNVAMIGTGRMGAAMVGRFRGAGFPVVVHNRTRSKAEQVADAQDCSVADSPREAVAGADVVVVSLADDDALLAAYGGADGILAGLRAGAVVCDASTVAPATVRGLAERAHGAGAALLDTPVSGSVSTVESGGLVVMAGGDPDALDRARPVLDSMARHVVHLGPVGTGAAMKLAVNGVLHGLNIALSEALVLAERAGIEREAAYDVIAGSAIGSPFMSYKRAAFLDPDGTPVAFALDLVAKDLELAAALADEVGAPTPQLARNREVIGAVVAAGLGPVDLSAVAEYLRAAG